MISESDLTKTGYSVNQIAEINAGQEEGLDISFYLNRDFNALQMRQIRMGLENGVDVKCYALTDYDWIQMEEIRKGLERGVDVSKYDAPDVTYDRMRQIRKALEKGIDLTKYISHEAGILRQLRKAVLSKISIVPYIKEGYGENQLDEIRISLEKKINIKPYISPEFRGVSIREIALGLESKLDVSLYAKMEYSWRQMREIRLGLENRLDVSEYLSPLYDHNQMKEIRLGLESDVDITEYKSFMYPGDEMREIRLRLEKEGEEQKEKYLQFILNSTPEEMIAFKLSEEKKKESDSSAKEEEFTVIISSNEMEAFFSMNGKPHPVSLTLIEKALKQNGIVYGIDDEAVSKIVNGSWKDNLIRVAHGTPSVNGEDGKYEYFFRTNVAKTPKAFPDGSLDYTNIEWFEVVTKGQKLVKYHRALQGKEGTTVTGHGVPARNGHELPVLHGYGFRVDKAGENYYSLGDGIIEINNNKIEISPLLILDEVSEKTGNVEFDGNVYIKGTVSGGRTVSATRDVVVDGPVNMAGIVSGGSIVLRSGAKYPGEFRADGDVLCPIFEGVRVYAGGDIRGDYVLNSELYTEGRVVLDGRYGTIAGGYTEAEMGIDVRNLGFGNGVDTKVKLGLSFNSNTKLTKIVSKLKSNYEDLELLEKTYKDYQKKYPPEVRNNMPVYLKIEAAIYTKEQESIELLDIKLQLEEKKKDIGKTDIVVRNTLHEKVHFDILGMNYESQLLKAVRIHLENKKVLIDKL